MGNSVRTWGWSTEKRCGLMGQMGIKLPQGMLGEGAGVREAGCGAGSRKPTAHPAPGGLPHGLGSAGRGSPRHCLGLPWAALPGDGTSLQSSQGKEPWVF